MPTPDEWTKFLREIARLTEAQQDRFIDAMKQMVADLRARKPFRTSLRVKGVPGHPAVFEMTWEMPNGRATFHYGTSPHPGDVHIVWRRIGGHQILANP